MKTERRSLSRIAFVGVGAVALSIALELLNRPTVSDVFVWLGHSPREVTCNAMFAVLFAWALLALTGRVAWALLGSAGVLGMVGVLHAAKVAILGRPLFPWDIVLQYREAWAMLPEVGGRIVPVLALALALAVGIVVAGRRERELLPWRMRAVIGGVVALVCWTIFPQVDRAMGRVGVQRLVWRPLESYRVNGLLLGFALNTNSAVVRQPAGYDSVAVRTALGRPRRTVTSTARQQPTVVVVMSESFFDPTRLPRVQFLDDPIPTVHRLQQEFTSGTLYPPVFGGGTANTEFEVLTGHAMRFLPAGSVPYQQYLHRKHPSLATLFAAQGYQTVAVHTFHRWFWEREQVYGYLGFHRFLGLEDMPGAVVDGSYPSDAMLTSQLIEQFEQRTGPLFLFGVSMEAHGPYQAGRYPAQTVRFDSELDEEARAQLATYVEAANHADRELGALVSYFSKVNTPVFIVFFGDHLPSLPRVLSQTGVIGSLDELDLRQRDFLSQVPLLIWTNTPTAPRRLGSLSASFLGPVLLELTGTPGSPYTDFLNAVRRDLPVMVPGLVSDADGVISDEPPDSLRPLEQAWWTLEYDELFGEQYLGNEEG